MLLATLMLIGVSTAGCVTGKPAGDFCLINQPWYPSKNEVYDEATKRKIIAFNEYGEEHCGWKPLNALD